MRISVRANSTRALIVFLRSLWIVLETEQREMVKWIVALRIARIVSQALFASFPWQPD
jgi:hypothetical protein